MFGEAEKQALETFISSRFPEVFVVETEFKTTTGMLSVLADTDAGITIDLCAEVSRAIDEYLQSTDFAKVDYALTVSSPGVGKPLKLLRQYQKNIGRRVSVRLTEFDERTEGELLRAEETGITIRQMVPVAEGKKKKIPQETFLSFDLIKETRVVI